MGFQSVSVLFLLFSLVCIGFSTDSMLVTSISAGVGNGWKNGTVQISCASAKLLIEGSTPYSSCISDGTGIHLTYNGSVVITGKENITLILEVVTKHTDPDTKKDVTVGTNYTGVFIPDKNDPNKIHEASVTLGESAKPATTQETDDDPVPKTQAHLTVNYMHQQFEDKCKEAVKSRNGGAVAVAVIEGIALIAILAYFGYKTMVDHKRKQMAASYGAYDNNASRITVPDTIRMSDIPPPRDPQYASPPTVSQSTSIPPSRLQVQAPPTRSSAMTSPDLVVPTSSSQTQNPNQPSSGTFNDPFASLESW